MYGACIFCRAPLGANEMLERFPVGRRIAYDQDTGRLWVVCRSCERWNLSPLETRWEAIEDAERLFRATPLKVAGENIGLAQTAEGLELVRIGRPPRIELAAWRYGDQFGRRHRRHLAMGSALVVAGGASSFAAVAAIAGLGISRQVMMGGQLLSVVYSFGMLMTQRRGKARLFVHDQHDEVLRLDLQDARMAALVPGSGGSWSLELPHKIQIGEPGKGAIVPARSSALLSGGAALRALSRVLPYLNRGGGSRRNVNEAVEVIAESGSLESLVRDASVNTEARRTHFKVPKGKSNVGVLPARIRLAMEMALHEDDERRAMEGELAELETRWREADALAAVTDSLLLPESVEAELEALKRQRPG
jgi:hypothetical protein